VVEANIHDQGHVLIHILKMVVCLVPVIQVVLTTVTQLLAQLRLQDNMCRMHYQTMVSEKTTQVGKSNLIKIRCLL
jgi:hypothetical protein